MNSRFAVAAASWLLLTSVAASAQDIEDRYRSGTAAFEQRNALLAIELLLSVAEQQPAYRDTQILLGQSYLMTGDDRAAKRHFERALQSNPQNGQAAFLLGFSLYQGARYFEAAEALERAVQLSPQHPLPKMYRGLALLRLGEVDAARQQIHAALQLAPEDPVALSARAELELSVGNYEEAEASIRAVLAGNPNDTDGQLLLGRVLLESERPDEATATLTAALAAKEATKRSDALYLLAQAQLRSGEDAAGQRTLQTFRLLREKEERVRLLRTTVSTEPDNIDAGVELVELLLELGQEQMAQLQLADLHRRSPADSRVRALVQSMAD